MQIHYKHNGRDMVYADYRLPTIPREPPEPVSGPFERCTHCPYPGHGFVCWHADEGKCLRTEVARIMERERQKSVGFSGRGCSCVFADAKGGESDEQGGSKVSNEYVQVQPAPCPASSDEAGLFHAPPEGIPAQKSEKEEIKL